MKHSLRTRAWVIWVALATTGLMAARDPAQRPEKSLSDLSLEVAALQTLYVLDLTRPQLEELSKLAQETVSKRRPGPDVKASEAFRKSLTGLRDALALASDGKRIERLAEDYGKLEDVERPDLDDDIDVTEEAADAAPELLRLLKPRQVALYAGSYADSFPDPNELLLEGIAKVRAMSEDQWAVYRDEVSEELAQLLAGLDEDKGSRIRGQVAQLLIVIRSLKKKDFSAQRLDLEKKARKIVGDVGPTEVLRNTLERALAELLSNPGLPAALEARLRAKK